MRKLKVGERARPLGIAFVHLAVVWAFAVAQPLLDLLGDAPEFFVARENTRGDILVLAFCWCSCRRCCSPAWRRSRRSPRSDSAGRSPRPRRRSGGAFFPPGAQGLVRCHGARPDPARRLGRRGRGCGVRPHACRAAVLTVLGPAPLVFLAMFLLGSPVSKLVLPGGEVEGADVPVPSQAPVVMIVLDEFSGLGLLGPGDRIDASAYPNFARLADDSTWYRNATTVADFTGQAVPALVTGERPRAAPSRPPPTTRRASSPSWAASTTSTSPSPSPMCARSASAPLRRPDGHRRGRGCAGCSRT